MSHLQVYMPQSRWETVILLPVLALIILRHCLLLFLGPVPTKPQLKQHLLQIWMPANPLNFKSPQGQQETWSLAKFFSANAAYVEILQKEVKQIFNSSIGCGADMQSMYHTEFIDQDAMQCNQCIERCAKYKFNMVWQSVIDSITRSSQCT